MPTATRKPAKPFNRSKAIKLHNQGLTNPQIAAELGVHKNTIQLFLRRLKDDNIGLDDLKQSTGDILHRSFGKCADIEDKLLSYFGNDDVLANLSDDQKDRLLGRITIMKGVTFDKIRLHEGKSTGNISHRVLLEQTCQDEWTTKGKALKVSGDDEKPQ